MVVQKQNIDVVFATGLETRTDSKLIPPTKMLDVQNMVQSKTGTLEKRPGKNLLSSQETTSNASYYRICRDVYSLHSIEDELVCVGLWEAWDISGGAWAQDKLYSGPQALVWQSSASKWRASNGSGVVVPVSFSISRAPMEIGQRDEIDVAHANGFIGVISRNTLDNWAYITIIERSTGAVLLDDDLWANIGATGTVRAIGNGNYLEFYAFDGVGNTEWAFVDTTSAIPSAITSSVDAKIAGAGVTQLVDMIPYGSYNYFVYETGTDLVIEMFSPGSATALYSYVCDGGGGRLNIDPRNVVSCTVVNLTVSTLDGTYLVVAYCDNADNELHWIAFNLTDLTVELGPWELDSTVYAAGDPDHLAIGPDQNTGEYVTGWIHTDSGTTERLDKRQARDGSLSSVKAPFRNESLETNVFSYGGRGYLYTANEASGQESWNLRGAIDSINNQYVVARLFFRNAEVGRSLPTIQRCAEVESGKYLAALRRVRAISGEGDGIRSSVELVEADFNTRHLQSLKVSNQLLIGSGVLTLWDGQARGNGINAEPPAPTLNATAAAGGNMSDGVYSYKIVYEWTDADGRLHRSPASIALAVTLAHGTALQTVTLNIFGLDAGPYTQIWTGNTNKGVRLVIYRTTAGGTIYYRLDSESRSNNNETTYVDSVSDASITDNAALYSDSGGEVETVAPNGCACMCMHLNRVILVPWDDRELIQYSHELIDGHGVEFSELLVKRVSGGDINALLSMDDKIIIATDDRLRYVVGDGASRAGTGANWSKAYPIQCETGIASWKHVTETPQGFVFFSDRGFFFLGRDLSVTHMTPPWDYRTKTVRYCLTLPYRKQVRWVFTDDTALLLDYEHNTWTRELNAVDQTGCVHNDKLYTGDSSGNLYEENTAKWQDNTTNIDTLIDTGWLAIGGITGYQRLWEILLLGEYHSSHTLTVKLYYNNSDTLSETKTLAISSDPAPYLMRVKPAKQRCTSVRLRIETSGASGKAASFTGLRFVVGVSSTTPVAKAQNLA